MKKLMSRALSSKRMIAIFLALSFIVGTAALTYVQAETSAKQSVTIQIYPKEGELDKLTVWLTIHHYTPGPKFSWVFSLLKIRSDYSQEITVQRIHVESWSDVRGTAGAFKYGENTWTDIVVPAGETIVIWVKQRVERFGDLIIDDTVYSYYSIEWTHGSDDYFKAGRYDTSAIDWWHMLYPF